MTVRAQQKKGLLKDSQKHFLPRSHRHILELTVFPFLFAIFSYVNDKDPDTLFAAFLLQVHYRRN